MSVVEKIITLEWNTKYIQLTVVLKNVSWCTHSVPCLCIIWFNLCWFISLFAISLNSQCHVFMSWCRRKIYKQSTYCWYDTGNPRGVHGSSHYFATASEIVSLLSTTVIDRLCLLQMTTCSHFSPFLLLVRLQSLWKKEIKIIELKTFQWLDLIVDASIAMQLKLLMYYSSWKQFSCSNFGRNLN